MDTDKTMVVLAVILSNENNAGKSGAGNPAKI